ncbi:MAG: undecaprenyl-diphosphate phosphatase [Gemmobacter sp.]
MPLWQLVVLALVQGVTEFLPISSSAHLIVIPQVAGAADQGLLIDVALHVGTLGAVVVFFRRDVGAAARGTAAVLRGRFDAPDARLALALAVATLPVIAAGLVLKLADLADALRSVAVIGWATVLFAIVLWWADRRGGAARTLGDWGLREAVVLGLWQAVALIPGTSRSGACMTGARLLGFGRVEAARIATLMSNPPSLGSGARHVAEIAATGAWGALGPAALAAVLAFVAALGALAVMMRVLDRIGFGPFILYRLIMGAGLLAWAYL